MTQPYLQHLQIEKGSLDEDIIFSPSPKRILEKLHFEIVHGCNLRCVGCPISTLLPKVKRVTPEVFEECMRNVDVEQVHFLRLFNYGEPLLHDNITGLLNIVPKLPYKIHRVEISTNGQYAHWEDLEKAFQTGLITQLAVSCDGDGTAESYERLRPPGKWEKLLEFFVRIKDLQQKYSPQMALITRTICTEKTGQDRWLELLTPLGWRPEFRDWLILPDASENPSGRTLNVPQRPCKFLIKRESLYIDYDGTVIPCCAHPGAGNWGNLRQKKYNEIMLDQPRKNMFRAMRADRSSMRICNACEF